MLIGQEKQRISERLERLVAEREKLSAHFNELEIAERVLARFEGKAATTGKVERARPANTAPALDKKHRSQGKRQMPATSLSDAILKAVQAHDEGATASEVLNYLSREFGMAGRPNHLGICAATPSPCREARQPRSGLALTALSIESGQSPFAINERMASHRRMPVRHFNRGGGAF
jgi:hypothetical protein